MLLYVGTGNNGLSGTRGSTSFAGNPLSRGVGCFAILCRRGDCEASWLCAFRYAWSGENPARTPSTFHLANTHMLQVLLSP